MSFPFTQAGTIVLDHVIGDCDMRRTLNAIEKWFKFNGARTIERDGNTIRFKGIRGVRFLDFRAGSLDGGAISLSQDKGVVTMQFTATHFLVLAISLFPAVAYFAAWLAGYAPTWPPTIVFLVLGLAVHYFAGFWAYRTDLRRALEAYFVRVGEYDDV